MSWWSPQTYTLTFVQYDIHLTLTQRYEPNFNFSIEVFWSIWTDAYFRLYIEIYGLIVRPPVAIFEISHKADASHAAWWVRKTPKEKSHAFVQIQVLDVLHILSISLLLYDPSRPACAEDKGRYKEDFKGKKIILFSFYLFTYDVFSDNRKCLFFSRG